MDIYRLTNRGEALAHNIYAPSKPTWKVLFYLSRRNGEATKEQIMNNVPNVTWHTLLKLRNNRLVELAGRTVEV
jgi:hypothetical protein